MVLYSDLNIIILYKKKTILKFAEKKKSIYYFLFVYNKNLNKV